MAAMKRLSATIVGAVLMGLCLMRAEAQTDEALREMYFRRGFAAIENFARTGDTRAEAWMGLIEQQASHRSEAKVWWRRAAEKDNRWAISMLAEMHRNDGENNEAMHWYRRGAELDDPEMQAILASRYDLGRIVTRNETEAVRWYRAAVASNYPHAYLPLAEHFASGTGVARDPVEAYALVEIASHTLPDSDSIGLEKAKALKGRLAVELGAEGVTQAARRADVLRPDLKGVAARRALGDTIMTTIIIAVLLAGLATVGGLGMIIFWTVRPVFGAPTGRPPRAPG
jgi:hypothetical protein